MWKWKCDIKISPVNGLLKISHVYQLVFTFTHEVIYYFYFMSLLLNMKTIFMRDLISLYCIQLVILVVSNAKNGVRSDIKLFH